MDRPIRVLFVDTAPSGSVSTKSLEAQAGVDVLRADGSEVDLDAIEDIDCIVCVHRPPEFDGLACLKDVRTRRPNLPVVMYAPDGDQATFEAALAAGASDWLPVAPETEPPAAIVNRVRNAIEHSRQPPEHLEETLDRITDAFFALDDEWRFTYVNDRAEEILDRDRTDLLGAVIWEAFPEAVGTTFQAEYERAMETQQPASFEELFPPLETWFAVRAYPSETGLSVYFRDVNERIEREQELEQYRAVTEVASDVIIVIDDESTVISANPAVADIFGYEPNELVGEPVTKLMADDVAVTHHEAIGRYLQTGERSFEWDYVELPGRHRDGHEVPLAVSLNEYEYGDERYFAGIIRDNTERKRRERQLEQYETIVETIDDGVYVTDGNARITLVNDALVELSGYDRTELLGEPTSKLVGDEDRALADEMTAEMLAGERTVSVIETEIHTADGDVVPVETRISPFPQGDERDGRVGIVRDITERRRFERTLTALHEATRDLVLAESASDICEITVETATQVLDLSGVGVYLYDPEKNQLAPESYSLDAEVIYGELPTLQPGEGLMGNVFVTGETLVIDDAAQSERVAENSTNLQSGVFVPLGDHGVLAAVSTVAEAFDDRTIQLVDLLAATTEATLDRVARESDLREHDREMRGQAKRLERLAHLTEKLRAVERAIVAEETRVGIEEAVCEALANTERYEFAWIGESDYRDDTITPSAWGGDDKGYLDAVSVAIDDDPAGEPAGRTAATGEPTLVADVAERLREAPWRGEALSRNLRSALSVPITHNDVTYGVLTVYAAEPDGFDELAADVFTELAGTVAFAINGVESRRALVADRVVELELAVQSGTGFLQELARLLDCQVEFEGEVTSAGGDRHVFFTTRGGVHDRVVDSAKAIVGVENIEVVAGEGGEQIYRATVSGPTFAREFASLGAMARAITAVGDETRVVVELPRTTDVRAFVTSVQSRYPDVELLARRERDRPALTRRGLLAELDDRLTDRQQEALQTAYFSGFFETPRETTAVELGRALDISQPTFTGHLRTAERKLLELLFGDDLGSSPR